MCMVDISDVNKDRFNIIEEQPVAFAQAKAPITGINVTDVPQKLPLNTTDYNIVAKGGFTFDAANNRFYWDQANQYNITLKSIFIGDAGLTVTAGLGASVEVSLLLYINGVEVLRTPLNFTFLSSGKSYGANSPIDILQGSYIEYFIVAESGASPTVTLNYFEATDKGR